MPVWRRDEDAGRAFALNLTATGLKAVATKEDNSQPEESVGGWAGEETSNIVGAADPRHRGLARQQGSPRRPAARRLQTSNRRLCRRRPGRGPRSLA